MPDTITEEAPFGTNIGSIFDKTIPLEKDQIESETSPEPEPKLEPKPEPKPEEKKPEKKAVKSKIEVPTVDLPESIFADLPKEEKKDEITEPVATPIPENIKSEPARKAFADLDTKRLTAEKELQLERKRAKELEVKVAAGDPDAKTRIQQLEEQLKGYDVLVQRASLQDHPQFQARYVIPRNQLLQQAKTAFKDVGGNPEQLDSALELSGKSQIDKLEELLGEVQSGLVRRKIENAIDNIQRIDSEKETVLKNSAEYNKRLQQEDQVNRHRALEEHAKRTKVNLSEASTILRDQFNIGLFKKTDDPKYAWWNAEVDKMDVEAEKIMLATENEKEMAMAGMMVAGFPRAWKLFLEERKARIATQKKLAEYEDSEPGLGGNGAKTHVTEQEDEEVPLATAILGSIHKAQGRT